MQNAPGLSVSDIAPPMIAHRYELGPATNLGRPGHGASSLIHSCRYIGDESHSLPNERVLLELPSQGAGGDALIRALECEVERVKQIVHPNVVRVHELVRGNGSAYVALDAPGVSLGRLLQAAIGARVRIPASVISSIVGSALEGLAVLHDQLGSERAEALCTHREFGPESIWVTSDGCARVLDVGFGRALEAGHAACRHEASWSLPYASPEQVTGTPAGISSDTYSACVVLWEALTQTNLFERDTREGTIEAILEGDIPPAEVMNLGTDIDLSWLVRGLSYDGPARYATARELAQELAYRLAPATPQAVTEWLHRLLPRLGGVRSEPRQLASTDTEDTETTRVSSLSQYDVPDGSDELTLIACEVSDEEAPTASSRTPSDAALRAKSLAESLGVTPTEHGESPQSKRRQYTVDSVSPKLIERLAAVEAAENRPKSGVSSDPPALSGVTSVIAAASSRSPLLSGSARLVLLVAAGVVSGTVVSLLIALRMGEPSAPPLTQAAVAVAAQPEPQTCPAVPDPPVTPVVYEVRAESRPMGHTQRVQPAPAQRLEISVAAGELAAAAPAEPASKADVESPIVVPRALHPRPNPLMSSKQVFSSRR
jgi:serine/threonine protein kinase